MANLVWNDEDLVYCFDSILLECLGPEGFGLLLVSDSLFLPLAIVLYLLDD
jgi:hypothetical protein